MPAFLIQLVIAFALELISVALAPKPKKATPAALQTPQASAGMSIPKVFGTITVTGVNVLWYGDVSTRQRNAN